MILKEEKEYIHKYIYEYEVDEKDFVKFAKKYGCESLDDIDEFVICDYMDTLSNGKLINEDNELNSIDSHEDNWDEIDKLEEYFD